MKFEIITFSCCLHSLPPCRNAHQCVVFWAVVGNTRGTVGCPVPLRMLLGASSCSSSNRSPLPPPARRLHPLSRSNTLLQSTRAAALSVVPQCRAGAAPPSAVGRRQCWAVEARAGGVVGGRARQSRNSPAHTTPTHQTIPTEARRSPPRPRVNLGAGSWGRWRSLRGCDWW